MTFGTAFAGFAITMFQFKDVCPSGIRKATVLFLRNVAMSVPLILFACAVFADDRPLPLEDRVKRIQDGIGLYGIVHWGLNAYTDRERGFGNEGPALLAPTSFDAGQVVRSAKAGGLQGLTLVAKHHDGFCLWPTKATEYNITKSPLRGAKSETVVLSNRFGRVEVSTDGAQVISYRPAGRQDVLFMPDDCDFSRDREMHGGIPVCWPWFGRKDAVGSRMHGLARYCRWTVAGRTNGTDFSRLVLTLDSSEETRKKWPHDFHLKYDVVLADRLTLTLTAKNTGMDPFETTSGFHPYFRVANPAEVMVCGLKEPLRAYPGIDGGHETESDGTYFFDAGDDLIEISAKGEKNLVVWNPGPVWKDWTPDCNLTTNDWRHFLCVEPAVIGVENARRIEPGESDALQMMIYRKN